MSVALRLRDWPAGVEFLYLRSGCRAHTTVPRTQGELLAALVALQEYVGAVMLGEAGLYYIEPAMLSIWSHPALLSHIARACRVLRQHMRRRLIAALRPDLIGRAMRSIAASGGEPREELLRFAMASPAIEAFLHTLCEVRGEALVCDFDALARQIAASHALETNDPAAFAAENIALQMRAKRSRSSSDEGEEEGGMRSASAARQRLRLE